MNTGKTILVAVATVVIFAAGVVTGGLLVHKTKPRQPTGGIPFLGRVEAISRTANQLDLTPDQRRRITDIVRSSREQIADYFVILEPDVQQVFRQMRQQIHAELTPQQREEFEEILRKRQHRQPDRRPGELQKQPPSGPGSSDR